MVESVRTRPVLFSGPMVRAILDGRKTQTRRAVKPQPPADAEKVGANSYEGPEGPAWFWWKGEGEGLKFWPPTTRDGVKSIHCPYGQAGDRLWVRETWQSVSPGPLRDWPGIGDQRPRKVSHLNRSCVTIYRADGEMPGDERWQPSIHMPREASRLLLDVVNVRVERLHDISEADAIAEGCDSADGFRELWRSINGDGAWDANPWVWVVVFRQVPEAGA